MADEGTYGSLAGMGAGLALSAIPGIGLGAVPLMALGGTGGGLVGSLFSKKPKAPDISGELAKISALFAQLRVQNTANINRESALGRGQAANNLAARGTYRAPVAENTFTALENNRVNSIANSDAQLAGQEAGIRANLLNSLLGYNLDYQKMGAQNDAARTGALTGLASNLLMAKILGGTRAPGASAAYSPKFDFQANYSPNFTDSIPSFAFNR
jgi:hypothetical protein